MKIVNQIKIDESCVVQCCSIGAYIEGGIDVSEIPPEVMRCPGRWKYIGGRYEVNPDYTPYTERLDELKAAKVTESRDKLAQWLEANPMLYTDGRLYSVTEEKQSLLNSNLASYERAKSMGIEYPLRWNSTGEECIAWTYGELVALSLAIAGYVAPKVSKQQELELLIKACDTKEELEGIVISYD